jgi:hypothetical protein
MNTYNEHDERRSRVDLTCSIISSDICEHETTTIDKRSWESNDWTFYEVNGKKKIATCNYLSRNMSARFLACQDIRREEKTTSNERLTKKRNARSQHSSCSH